MIKLMHRISRFFPYARLVLNLLLIPLFWIVLVGCIGTIPIGSDFEDTDLYTSIEDDLQNRVRQNDNSDSLEISTEFPEDVISKDDDAYFVESEISPPEFIPNLNIENKSMGTEAETDSTNKGDAYEKSMILPSRNLDNPVTRRKKDSYSLPLDMTKDIENSEDLVEVKFNFDAESIVNVVQMFSLTLEFQYYVDPAVAGSVTMTIDTEMTRREAWELFEHILWITGSYASKQHKFIHILPFAKLPQERRIFAKHDPIPNVDVSMIRLFNTAAADIANLIRPFMTAGATASPIQYLNSLLIVEAPPNMNKLRELIEKLDVAGEKDWPQTSLACNHVDSSLIIEELQKILPIIGFPVTTSEQGDGHSIKLLSLDRLQVIIVAAPTVEVIEEVRRWVKILDRDDTVSEDQIFFYNVKYNKAEDLSDSIGAFFNTSGTSTGTRRSSTSTGSTPQTGTDATQRGRRPQSSSQRNRNQRSSTDKPSTVFDVPVSILEDGNHNRLVIKTSPRVYAILEALLKRLDTPPLQVLIQVMIAEISLSKDTEFGFRLAAKTGGDFTLNLNPFGGTGGNIDRTAVITSNDLYGGVLSTKGISSAGDIISQGDIFSFIRAVAGKSNTRVLSSPQLIAISDEEASINIGNSVPIITEQLNTSGTGTGNINQNIQYQDTGTILTVTPHITAKKLVTLDIRQEVSNALDVEAGASIQSPVITNRVIETSMIVEDGSTVLLGGFIETKKNKTIRKLPIIGDIPYLGKLFSFNESDKNRTELLLIITVKVIDIETDVEEVIKRYESALSAIQDDLDLHLADELKE